MPFMLRVVIVRVVGGGCDWIGRGEVEEIVVGEDCWFIEESGWSVVVGGVGWLCAAGGDI
jgi:hypothetical protein